MQKISVIVPCYNEQAVLHIFYEAATKVLTELCAKNNLDYELIFINDCSKDGTLAYMRALHQKDAHVRYLSFSRNFGKEAGIYAGLEASTGDYVAMMDADLQDPPELLFEMYDALKSGEADCAAARRLTRKGEPAIRSFFARCFYKFANKVSKTEIVDGARDFRLMTRQMVNAVLQVSERNRFSKGIFSWVGYRTKWIGYENVERAAGDTKWSFWTLFVYAVDGIIAFSTAPLTAVMLIGIAFALLAFLMILVIIFKTLIFGDPVAGYPSLICVIFLVSGVQLLCLGVLGQYLAKTYLEVKNRPIYLIQETSEDAKLAARDSESK